MSVRGPAKPKLRSISPDDLHGPLARILRPIVRLCIKSGLTFPALSQLLRAVYVNVAENEFSLEGKAQTDSRVSLLTGVHRKEVGRLRGEGAPVHTVSASISRTSALISHWIASSDYLVDGKPMPLPRFGKDGEASFESLVEEVTRDVRPRAILDDWLESGIVKLDSSDRVVLQRAAYIPKSGDNAALHYLGRNVGDHLAAAEANITSEDPKFFERAVHYDKISAKLAERLVTRARELGDDALQQANRDAHKAVSQGDNGAERLIFGVYIYRESGERGKANGQRPEKP